VHKEAGQKSKAEGATKMKGSFFERGVDRVARSGDGETGR